MKGIALHTRNGCTVCIVQELSDELRQRIREQLQGIFHGFADVEELPTANSYQNTLQSFLDRYETKDSKTQKGMIAELISHVLIHEYQTNLESLSVLKNKEDRSIKKGFDIIYYSSSDQRLLYSEVKSGNPVNKTVSDFSVGLLKIASEDIFRRFSSQRLSLWDSALTDVKLTIEEGTRRKKIREILASDTPYFVPNIDQRNVILVSMAYKDSEIDSIMPESIEAVSKAIIESGRFSSVLIFAQQKRTFEAVADFLRQEIR